MNFKETVTFILVTLVATFLCGASSANVELAISSVDLQTSVPLSIYTYGDIVPTLRVHNLGGCGIVINANRDCIGLPNEIQALSLAEYLPMSEKNTPQMYRKVPIKFKIRIGD